MADKVMSLKFNRRNYIIFKVFWTYQLIVGGWISEDRDNDDWSVGVNFYLLFFGFSLTFWHDYDLGVVPARKKRK